MSNYVVKYYTFCLDTGIIIFHVVILGSAVQFQTSIHLLLQIELTYFTLQAMSTISINTWSEIQNYTCKPVLLDSAQAICVKKSHLQLLGTASLHYILLITLSKMSKIMPKKHTFWLRNWFHWNQHTLIMLKILVVGCYA